MRLDESLFEGVRIDPNFDEIEKALKSVKGTGKVEFDYRPDDGVYKKPEDHFIVLIDEDTEALEEGNKEDFKLYYKNRREWKLGVVNKLNELGWMLEDPMEDNSSYLYLVVEKDNLKKEGYEIGSPFSDAPGHKVEVYSDYHKALKRAKELGLKEAEYGDVFGTQFSYCCWNKSGDRNEYEDVIAYYTFEDGKLKSLDNQDREYLEKEKGFTFDNSGVKESLTEATSEKDKLLADLFTQYLDSETPYQKVNGAYDVEIYADYRDEIDEKSIESILESNNPEEHFYNLLMESHYDAEGEYRIDIEDGFKTWVKGTNPEIDMDELSDWLLDYFYDFVDIHPDYDHFKSQEIKTILLLDTGDANYDFTLNPSYVNDYGRLNNDLSDDASIVWLVKQQGHSKDELVKALNDEESSNKFMQSIVDECFNTTSSMNALVLLGKCTLGQLLDIDNNTSVVVNKDAVCGLVDTWAGGGSLLGIELEKDVVVPSNIIHYFGADGSNGGYSVDSIYGLTGSVWKDVFTIKGGDVKESLTEKMWEKKVPQELAKAFHIAVNDDDNPTLRKVKEAVDAICDWLEQEDEDLEWDVQEVRDAWDIVDIDDRFGDFDPDFDGDDDFADDRTNEDFVNEEVISVLYDILDAYNIWMPLEHELSEDIDVEIQPHMEELKELAKKLDVEILSPMQDGDLRLSGTGYNLMKFYQEAEKKGLWKVNDTGNTDIKESFNSLCNQLVNLKEHKLSDVRFTKDLVESVSEIQNAVAELKTKYFEE